MFLQVLNFVKISWFVYQGVNCTQQIIDMSHVIILEYQYRSYLYNSEILVENYKRFCKGDNHRHDPFKSSWKFPYLKVSMHMNLLWGSNMATYGKTQELSKWHTWVMDRWGALSSEVSHLVTSFSSRVFAISKLLLLA